MARIVIVGASLAGLRAAEGARGAGFDGEIVLVGAETHPPYDRPPLSKELLAGTWDVDRLALRATGTWDADLDVRLGVRAASLDVLGRQVVLEGGEPLPYDALVIATGAEPRWIPGTRGREGVHVLRTIEDALALRAAFDTGARVAVIGAGFIGAEVAATARRRGLEVTVVEALPVPLVRGLGAEMGAVAAALHRDEGVDLRTNVTVTSLLGDGPVEGLRLDDGTTVAADVVVVGVGVRPSTDWLEGSGLELRDGVACDEHCEALGAPGVFAAGDVARWFNPLFGEEMRLEHWTNAAEQGDHAGRNAARRVRGEPLEPFAPVPYFWSDQYDTKIQYVGRAGGDDEVRVVAGSVAERKFVAVYGREGRLTGCLGFSMPRKLMRFRSLLAERASFDDALALAET